MSDLNLEIGLAIAQSAALPDLLVRCGQVLEHYLETLSVGVWLLNPQTNTLTLQHPWGDLPPPEAFPPSVPLGVQGKRVWNGVATGATEMGSRKEGN